LAVREAKTEFAAMAEGIAASEDAELSESARAETRAVCLPDQDSRSLSIGSLRFTEIDDYNATAVDFRHLGNTTARAFSEDFMKL
jgi:hypothetical protein